ncbi:capsular biosynthesis protein [Methylobacterium sp. NEAU 140]|uniref:capsular polysaccharide export protein, LipB/KpsS family n=1 Tax=Methylobacterium sp. NEAU 140 TaxID=3064945 RepID=UPI0027330ADA|nr:capsular biosynthesis protein [Methylobacterium sp. NEAU 140]MDP4023268.1 capsular biosynthesis protein [Methylobacterium sp. NEAU 140]
MRPEPAPTLYATGPTIRRLRAEIEAASGLAFGPFRPGAVGAAWGAGSLPARALAATGRRRLIVGPGPLVSPYDGPETGFASLRLTLDGAPLGGADGVHYLDPWTRAPIDRDACAERVAWLAARFGENDRRVVYVGMSRWKRPALDVLGLGPAGRPVHTMTTEAAITAGRRHGGRVLAWSTRAPGQLEAACAEAGLPLARVEDGFLRSVGLGASLQPGASIVVDDLGIYYDPRRESRLQRLLAESAFPPDLVARARALREAVVARRLSKYNVGLDAGVLDWPAGRRIVLVPGQVEDDASVQHGSPLVRSNKALLAAARARNPDAFLLYKPHPDVEAGYRPGRIPEAEALALADRIVGGVSIVDLLDRVHHVETMTSLAGFEALIRGLTVATHGRPFYAGWGLSEDLAPGADRGRRLALDELVAGAMILYPRYLDPVAMKPCTPEQLLDRLSEARAAAPPSALAIGRLAHLAMRVRYGLTNPIVRALRSRRGVGREAGPR